MEAPYLIIWQNRHLDETHTETPMNVRIRIRDDAGSIVEKIRSKLEEESGVPSDGILIL